MKRFLALLLAMVMILSLAACGEKKTETAPEPAPEPKVLTYSVYTAASNGSALIATGGTDGLLTEMIAGTL